MDRKKFIKRLLALILFIFLVNLLAYKFYWYYSIWYFDMIVHFLGGFWVGFASFYLFTPRVLSWRSILVTLGFVLLMGVAWEIFQFLSNNYLAQNPVYILDISSDIFFDLAGGALAILYFFHRIMVGGENTV